MMLPHIGQGTPEKSAVDRVEDVQQHDRTPLFGRAACYRDLRVRPTSSPRKTVSSDRQKRFVGNPVLPHRGLATVASPALASQRSSRPCCRSRLVKHHLPPVFPYAFSGKIGRRKIWRSG